MSRLKIKDMPPVEVVDGTEIIPTGGKGDVSVTVERIKNYVYAGTNFTSLASQLQTVDLRSQNNKVAIDSHIADLLNPHQVTKAQVGLGNVDNTSDLNKPISTATQAALTTLDNTKANTTYVDAGLNTKANITYVDDNLALKSDITYVDSQDLLKEDKLVLGISDLTAVSSFDNVKDTNNLVIDSTNQALLNRTEYLKTHNNLVGRDTSNSHPTSAILDSSGKTQQQLNNGLASIVDLATVPTPITGSRVFVKGFQGDDFVYDATKSAVNDGHHVFNGWVRHVPYLHVSPLQWGADPTGATDSTAAFQAWAAHLNYMTFNSAYPPCGLIPSGYYIVSDTIEFYDIANCTIYSLGAMIGYVGANVVDSILKINNAVNSKIVGSLTLTGWNTDKAQCGLLITASTGSALQASGIANHIDIMGVTARNLVCGFQIGEDLQDYDKHVAELHFVGCNTMMCRTAVRNYGSQTESSFDGCTLASGFFNETDTSVYHALLDIRGGIVTVNGGSLVNSMLPNTFLSAQGIVVKPAKSTLYNNPYPVIAINASHIELTTQMLSIEHGGITTNSSALSNVSIQDCKGWMGMIPSEALIRIWDTSYVGKLSIGSSNNFYTSLNRTGKNIICNAPNTILDVSSMAFGEKMQQGFAGIVGGILKHPLKLISYTSGLNASLATGKQPLIFTTANGSGDLARYAVYYTTNGNIQFPHKVKSINIKINIADPGINVVGDIFIEKNGLIVCYANKNTLFATLDYTDHNVLSTDVYKVYFNKSSSVTVNSGSVSNIAIYAET